MSKSLVVADDPGVCESLNKILAGLGLEVIQTSSAKQALQFLETDPEISLVVTDRIFKQKEGEWLIHSMKKNPRFQDLPVIVLAETSGIRDISNIIKIGARAFIPKPLINSYFKEYVLRYIDK